MTRNDDMLRAIDECERCRHACLGAVAHALDQGGRQAEAGHIATLLDCVEMCATAATFMLRESPAHRRVCEVCAEICDACAASCERFPDDELMEECAGRCRRCADSCRNMARSAAPA